ncbi:hypothetical protein ACLB2K_021937 [Fragaria x ananassa]
MHPQYIFAVLVLLVPLVVIVSVAAEGGWIPLSPSDPRAITVAQFAITEYNKNTTQKLVYQSLVSAEIAQILGTLYHLTIAAKNETSPTSVANYEAGVLVRHGQDPKLTAFHIAKS